MIFNHNAAEHSKRILFDDGFQNVDVTGGWADCAPDLTPKSWVTINNRLQVIGYAGSTTQYNRKGCISTVKPIDITELTKLHFYISNSSEANGKATVGVVSADIVQNNDNGWGVIDYAGNMAADPSLAVGGREIGTSTDEPQMGLWSMDVSDLSGLYYIYLYARYSYGTTSASVTCRKIWTE